jgi:hypothetical protein
MVNLAGMQMRISSATGPQMGTMEVEMLFAVTSLTRWFFVQMVWFQVVSYLCVLTMLR